MQLFQAYIFEGNDPEVYEGLSFYKGSLEINNPDGSTSLCGNVNTPIPEDRVIMYDGYLDQSHPHFLVEDLRPNETSGRYILTIVCDGFIDVSKSFKSKEGYMIIKPKRKKDRSLVLTSICLSKDEDFDFTIENSTNQKKRYISITYSDLYSTLIIEDVSRHFIKPNWIITGLRFLKRTIYKQDSWFGYP